MANTSDGAKGDPPDPPNATNDTDAVLTDTPLAHSTKHGSVSSKIDQVTTVPNNIENHEKLEQCADYKHTLNDTPRPPDTLNTDNGTNNTTTDSSSMVDLQPDRDDHGASTATDDATLNMEIDSDDNHLSTATPNDRVYYTDS